MKKQAVIVLAVVLSFVSAQASYNISEQTLACYEAQNPEGVVVSFSDDDGNILKKEEGRSAQLELVQTQFKSEDLTSDFKVAKISVRSASALTTSNPYLPEDESATGSNTYYIECDGGNVSLTSSGSSLIANSEYLASESQSSQDEGCNGSSSLTITNVVFQQVSCK